MSKRISESIARCYANESRWASRAEAFALLADKEGRSGLAQLFRVLSEAKRVHAKRFNHLMRGKIGSTEENLREKTFFVCRICGHIHAEIVPDNCPVCGAVPGRFMRVD